MSDYECSLKSVTTEEYLNTCVKCLQGLSIPYRGNGVFKQSLNEDDYSLEEEDMEYISPDDFSNYSRLDEEDE